MILAALKVLKVRMKIKLVGCTIRIVLRSGYTIKLTHVKEANFTLGKDNAKYSIIWTHPIYKQILIIDPTEIVAIEDLD